MKHQVISKYMEKISSKLEFFLRMAAVQGRLTRSFDTGLGNGLGFNDFVILFHLYNAPDQTMRRIDLAEAISVSASGITRMLLPMEKIGLVKRQESKYDGRVSLVKIAPGGKRLLKESMDRAETKADDLLRSTDITRMCNLLEIFSLFS